jgi:2'-5' RNA ligase
MEIRSFLAFELPSEIKDIVSQVARALEGSPIDLRQVKAENIHLTVVFLGNVRKKHIPAICNEAQGVCTRYATFNVSLEGAGVFGSRNSLRVLWIGLNGDIDRMSHFRDALQKELLPFGIKQETRRFSPHLTLGRFQKGYRPDAHLDKFLSGYRDLTSPARPLVELVLFRSDLKPGGAVYTKMDSWPLSGKR